LSEPILDRAQGREGVLRKLKLETNLRHFNTNVRHWVRSRYNDI